MKFAIQTPAVLTSLVLATAVAAQPKTVKEWEACVASVEATVSQQDVGVGAEAAVKARCGTRPATEPSSGKGLIGIQPYDLVRSSAWRPKFQSLAKGKYQSLVDRLAVSSATESRDGWVVGAGIAPRSGGSDEAAFAINVQTGEVFAALLEDGNQLVGFGFGSSWNSAPPYLQKWVQNRSDTQTIIPALTKPEANPPIITRPQPAPARAAQVLINAGATLCPDMISMNKALAISRANNPYAQLPDGCVVMKRAAPTRVLRESTPIPGVVVIEAGSTAAMILRSDLSFR